MYLDKLRRDHAAVGDIWLLGQHRGSGGETLSTLLLFGDEASLGAIRADAARRRPDLELLVVTDGDRYESVWGSTEPGRLRESGWHLEGPSAARFGAPLADALPATEPHALAARVR